MDFCDGVILSKCFLNTRSLFQLGFDTMCHYLCYLTWQRSWIINVCYSSALQQTSHVNFINVTVHLCMLRLETFCDSLTFFIQLYSLPPISSYRTVSEWASQWHLRWNWRKIRENGGTFVLIPCVGRSIVSVFANTLDAPGILHRLIPFLNTSLMYRTRLQLHNCFSDDMAASAQMQLSANPLLTKA